MEHIERNCRKLDHVSFGVEDLRVYLPIFVMSVNCRD